MMVPNRTFAALPDRPVVEATAQALTANGFNVVIVEDGVQAKQAVLDLLPSGAEVFNSTSRTLDTIGVSQEIEQSGRYNAVRPRLLELNPQTQRDEMRRLAASPEYVVGSVHALTQQGELVIASASGSQLGLYAYTAGRVILVVGTQKITPDRDVALRRVYEYSLPMEDIRAREAYGMASAVNKLLLLSREFQPERTTVVLVNEELGF